jgi:hypothetical protein
MWCCGCFVVFMKEVMAVEKILLLRIVIVLKRIGGVELLRHNEHSGGLLISRQGLQEREDKSARSKITYLSLV